MSDSKIITTIYKWRVRFGLLALILTVLFARPNLISLLTGLTVTILGLILRLWACGHLKKEKELTTSGPYRHTRNPLYLGNVIIGIGVVIGALGVGVVLGISFFYLSIGLAMIVWGGVSLAQFLFSQKPVDLNGEGQ